MLHLPHSPRPVGRMHLALREAIKRDPASGPSRAFIAIDIGLPLATSEVCHISDRGVPTDAVFYAPRVLRAGIGRSGAAVSERTSGLAGRTFTIELMDPAGDFREIAARYGNRLWRSTVVARIGHPDVEPADWCPHFTGLLDTWDPSGPASWTLECSTDDLPLAAQFPKHPFLLSDWPLCEPAILGKFAPIVLGVHNSTGVQNQTGTGMVPTFHVDSALYRHVVSLGKLAAVVPVYGNGTTISASDYSIVYVTTASGRVWTCVQFNVATHEAKVITVDCQGLTDRGDGTGVVVTDPVAQQELLLANFVLGDWKSGDWLTTALLDLPARRQASLYAARKAMAGSDYYGGEQTTGQEALDGLTSTFALKPWWTGAGQIALSVLDHGIQEYMGDALPWVRGRGDLKSFRRPGGVKQITGEVVVTYLPSAADGRSFETLKLQDLDVSAVANSTHDMPKSAARRS